MNEKRTTARIRKSDLPYNPKSKAATLKYWEGATAHKGVAEAIMTAAVTARETTIKLRAPAPQRALIDQAAAVQGKTRTDFMLEAAYERAQQVLLDRTVFALDAKTFKRFIALLDAPVKNNKAVGRLLTKRVPWDL